MSQFPASQRQPTPHAPSSQRHPPVGRPVWSSPPWPSPSPSRRRRGVLALPAQGHRPDPLRQELQPRVDLRCGNGKSSLALTAAALLHCECVINVESFHPCLILELRAYSIKSFVENSCILFTLLYCVLLLSCCYFFNYRTRQVLDTHSKPDWYGYEILPAGMSMDIKFYP
jgi:hypothetical protein